MQQTQTNSRSSCIDTTQELDASNSILSNQCPMLPLLNNGMVLYSNTTPYVNAKLRFKTATTMLCTSSPPQRRFLEVAMCQLDPIGSNRMQSDPIGSNWSKCALMRVEIPSIMQLCNETMLFGTLPQLHYYVCRLPSHSDTRCKGADVTRRIRHFPLNLQ